jgi:serine-type D-Ala-D-Ala endopeptidase (penicillin-binding protein 7)
MLSFLALVQWIVHRASTSRMWVRFLHAGPIFLALALVSTSTFAKPKQSASLEHNAQAVLLFDQKTNKIIEARNIYAQFPIASITKLMTAYVVLETKLDLDAKIKVVPVAVEQSNNLKNGTMVTRRELLLLTLIASDNKAARLLAESHPSGYTEFIAVMNYTAKSLNMYSTNFNDPSGLSVFNTSTAWDLHLLNRAVAKYSIFGDAAMSKTANPQAETRAGKIYKFIIRNTSALAGDYDLLVGKTGFTNAAKWCISMQVRSSGTVFDIVILGSPTKQNRNTLAKNLIKEHVGRLVSAGAMFNIEQIDYSDAR